MSSSVPHTPRHETTDDFALTSEDDATPDSGPTPQVSAGKHIGGEAPGLPRVLYIDVDDDLPLVLDRVEDAGTPAIVVLPEGARAVRGTVAARLLQRRAEAAGIAVVAVTTDRTTIAQLQSTGIPCASTVGEARAKLSPATSGTDNLPTAEAVPVDAALNALLPDDQNDDFVTMEHEAAPAEHGAPTMIVPRAGSADTIVMSPEQDQTATRTGQAIVSAPGRRPARTGRIGRWIKASMAALVVMLLGVATWIVFFPAATITITYADRGFDRIYQTGLGTGSPGAIPLHHTQISETASLVVTGTGSTLVPDGHGTGTITFANPADGYVIVPAGTVVDALNGSRFATLADVRVPGAVHSFSGTTNGQQNVAVRALLGGPFGNVAPGAVVRLEGRLAGVLLLTNYAAFSGGTMRTQYSLTAGDITAAVGSLKERLTRHEAATLALRFSRSPIRLPGPMQIGKPFVVTFTARGRVFAHVWLTVRTRMDYVHGEDVQRFADSMRDRELAGLNQRVIPGSEKLRISTQGAGAHREVVVELTDRTAPSIDPASLRALLVGRSVSEARQLLDGSAHNGGWQYTLHISPDLAHRLPQAENLINVQIHHTG